jgi:hypothetical protein
MNPQSVPGSALGAKTAPQSDIEAKNLIDGNLLDAYTDQNIDTINSTKFPTADNSVAYVAGGTLSVQKEDGKFVFSNDSARPTPGALRIDQSQSTITSTATEMKIGSETIKTLTGLIMNPSLVIRPSSNITPEKQWLKSLFPILTDSDYRAIFMYRLIQVSIFSALKILDNGKNKSSYQEHRSYKDLGTQIIENQDLEKKILSGNIKN